MPNAKRPAPDPSAGKFAYRKLDRVIHEKARLGIMTSLVAHSSGLAFTDLKDLCDLTDGNLNRHLDSLREAGLVEIRKDTRGRRTKTMCRITALGRTRFLEYLAELEHVVATAAHAAKRDATPLRRLSPAES
ncbi:MAG TPA: transcriptional regulator [Pirellulaceae bacterium]